MTESDYHIEKILEKHHVRDYTLETSSDPFRGKNFMGSLKSVTVRGKNSEGDDAEMNFVVKSAPVNEMFRRAHSTKSIYLREIYTYEKILPTFSELQKTHNVPVPFNSFPEFYASSKTDLKECVVLKDMFPLGYRNYDKPNGFDRDHALLVMKELAKFHALSFALRKKNFDAFCEIRNNARDVEYREDFVPTSRHVMDLFSNSCLKSLDEEHDKAAFDKFYSFRKDFVDVIRDAVSKMFDSEHAVVTHGDCWLANFLFKYQDGRVPSDVVLLDWQFTRIGSPAFDISQFLFICCEKEIRNKHYADLIGAYYASLSSFLRFFDEDANDLFPYEVLLEHLRKYSVFGLATTLRMKYILTVDFESLPKSNEHDDIHQFTEQIFNAKRNVTEYNKTMRDVVIDYINFGYNM